MSLRDENLQKCAFVTLTECVVSFTAAQRRRDSKGEWVNRASNTERHLQTVSVDFF